jgi:hypothetical protein
MIRKSLLGFTAMILLLTTTGITYHYHYCGNTLMSFSVFQTPEPCCENPEDCCHDRATTFQLKNDYLFSSECPEVFLSCLELPQVTFQWVEMSCLLVDETPAPFESPPPGMSLRLASLQTYRI